MHLREERGDKDKGEMVRARKRGRRGREREEEREEEGEGSVDKIHALAQKGTYMAEGVEEKERRKMDLPFLLTHAWLRKKESKGERREMPNNMHI